MAARTPSIHVFLGRPLFLLSPGIHSIIREENLDQKSPGPPGWVLMQWASSSNNTKKQTMLKNQTPSLEKI
jgi:hypothetical protein